MELKIPKQVRDDENNGGCMGWYEIVGYAAVVLGGSFVAAWLLGRFSKERDEEMRKQVKR